MHVKYPRKHLSLREGFLPRRSGSVSIFNNLKAALQKEDEEESEKPLKADQKTNLFLDSQEK